MYVRSHVVHEVIYQSISLSILFLLFNFLSFLLLIRYFGSILWAALPECIIGNSQDFYWTIGTFCKNFLYPVSFYYLAGTYAGHFNKSTLFWVVFLMNSSHSFLLNNYVCNSYPKTLLWLALYKGKVNKRNSWFLFVEILLN